MGVVDPRKLAVILRDLDDEMQRWSVKAGDMLNTATYTQMITREATHQARRQALITTEQYYEDEAVYRSRKQNIEDLVGKYTDAVRSATSLVDRVEKKRHYAEQVLEHWTKELQKAIAWQKRAEERVRRAEAELAAAERALAQAERDLSYAESELRRCQNTVHEERNSEGRVIRRWKPDCSGYVAAVNRAAADVRRCQERVRLAQIELREARAELARATARVKACEQAVEYARKGVAMAKLSLERAKSALSQSERALDHIRAAERALIRAGELLGEEHIRVEDMNVNIQQCEDLLSEAQVHLMNSTRLEESAQRYRIMARSELQHRIEMLYAINKPELLGGISGDGWLIGAGSFTTAVAMAVGAAGGAPSGQPDTTETPKDPTREGTWQASETVIAVADLPDVPELDDETAHKKIPRDFIRESLQRLMEMMKLMEDGIGLSEHFWADRDVETGTDPQAGYLVAYKEYYAVSPITVARLDDGGLRIVSGKERVWVAKRAGIPHLPVRLMTRARYLEPLRFTHHSGDEYEIRAYPVDTSVSLRIYNTTRRNKLPERMTDGDGTCVDLRFDGGGDAEVVRFDRREQGFDAEMLLMAEAVCQEKQASALFLKLEIKALNTPEKRDWFLSRGYNLSQEGTRMTVYKSLS